MNYLLQKLRRNSELNFDWIQRVKKTLNSTHKFKNINFQRFSWRENLLTPHRPSQIRAPCYWIYPNHQWKHPEETLLLNRSVWENKNDVRMSSIVLLHLNHSSLKHSSWAGQTRKQTALAHFSLLPQNLLYFKNNTRHHLPVSDDTAFYFIRQKGNKVANNTREPSLGVG